MARLSALSWKTFVMYVLCLSSVAAVEYSDQTSFDGGNYTLSWLYNATDDILYFKAVVATPGWVGLGFSDLNMEMKNLDCAVGGVAGGSGYLNDFHVNGKTRPTKDGQQSYNLLHSSEAGGKTTIEISRKRDTSDPNDMQFTVGKEVYVAWAYHTSKDAKDAVSYRHSKRGYSSGKLGFLPVAPTAATSVGPQATQAATSQPTGSQATQASTSYGSRVIASSPVLLVWLSVLFSM